MYKKQERLSNYTTNIKPKKILTKIKTRKLIIEYQKKIENLSVRFQDHVTRNTNSSHINYKIHYLLHDPFTLVNAYTRIIKNKEGLLKSFNNRKIMKFFCLESAKRIANKLKKNQYEFKPIKKIWILKPNKKKKQPIDIPPQSDIIVQEALKNILEAIYEPELRHWGHLTRHLSNNYGFRPNISTWTAVDKIAKYSQKCTTAIEGHIHSISSQINHEILLSILRQRIKDKKFLNLIKKLLENGIMDKDVCDYSSKGTPQKSTVSPLLFNIYMFGLDKFVYNEIIASFQKKEHNKTRNIAALTCKRIRYQINKSYKKLQKLKIEYKQKPISERKDKIKKALKEFKGLRNTQNLTQYGKT